MRLLSFVPCGCRAGPIDDAPPAAAAADHAGGGDAGTAARRRRRRRTLRAAAAGNQYWRPSLGDICEEYSTEAAAKARRGRVAPVRGGGASSWDVACRVLPRAHSDEYRHLESASSMRPLAPTAFLF